MCHPEGKPAELELVAGHHLEHASEPPSPQEPSHSARHHDGQRSIQPAERSAVEVIEMGVRHENPIERPEQAEVDRGVPAEMPHPAPEHRVGDEPRAVDVDHDGAVPQPGEPVQSMPIRIEY